MAKTKRRSCKGGRRSRRCRGGVPHRQPSHADIVNQVGREEAKVHFGVASVRNLAGRVRDSVGSLAGKTASAARGLRASFGNFAGRMTSAARMRIGLHGYHLDDHSKLVPVPKKRIRDFGLRENSAERLYDLDKTTGNLYERSKHLGPVGDMRDQTDEETARFLPGHEPKEGETWAIVTRD